MLPPLTQNEHHRFVNLIPRHIIKPQLTKTQELHLISKFPIVPRAPKEAPPRPGIALASRLSFEMLHCPISGGCPCHTLSQAETELAAAKAIVERLSLQTYRLKSTINAAHDPLTHRLPRELASRIFTFCTPGDYRDQFCSTLSLVCTAWRDIACSTPDLWNVISMRLRSLESASILQHTEDFLRRSGCLPLILEIKTHKDEDLSKFPSAVFYPLIDALNLHSHRWRTLGMCIPFLLTSRLNGSSPNGTYQLYHLTIESSGRYTDAVSRIGFGSPFGQKMRPAKVEMSGLYLEAVQIDWRHVKRVRVDSLSVGECLELLRLAPELRKLWVRNIYQDDSLEVQSSLTTHYSLKKLECSFWYPTFILYDRLILPALETLLIEGKGPYDSLERLLTRSSCRVSKFHLLETRGDNCSLIPVLRAMPYLEDLLLWDLDSYHEIGELCALMASTAVHPPVSDPSTLFLSQLKSFNYSGYQDLLWETIPSWFPPADMNPDTLYRPLTTLKIMVFIDRLQGADCFIDRDSLPGLLELAHREDGPSVEIVNINDSKAEDFIEASRKYHNLPRVGPDSEDEEDESDGD